MKGTLIKLLATLGLATVLVVIIALAVSSSAWIGRHRVPGQVLLEVDFGRAPIEYIPDEPLAKVVMGNIPRMRDYVEALERAAGDPRVVGLIARVGNTQMGLAQVQEIRNAVLAFRKSGKPAFAYGESFGEFGPGNGAYYLATAFNTIYLQPSGDLGLTGLISQTYFLGGLVDRLGLTPRIGHRQEYKTAMNVLTERKYTKAHREANKAVLESVFGQMVRGISQARKIPENQVRGLVDRGPFSSQEALKERLVDGLAYRDEVYATARSRCKARHLLYLTQYFERAGGTNRRGKTVALVYAVGSVTMGKSRYQPLSSGLILGMESVTAALRAAIDDKDVKAILLRIDSPGGSYVASDAIWRETIRAKRAGKPVVVSMGDMAGSGGYFIAMAADRIFAQPATITGSIGVLSGKVVTGNFWNRIGVTWDEVHTSKNADIWSSVVDYTPEQWAHLQEWLDRIYADFTSKVASGRGLSKERALRIAKGRIWTGEDAKRLGLIDELGGFPEAIQYVKKAIGVPANESIRLKTFPGDRSLLRLLWGSRSSSSEEMAASVAVGHVIQILDPVFTFMRQFGLVGDEAMGTKEGQPESE